MLRLQSSVLTHLAGPGWRRIRAGAGLRGGTTRRGGVRPSVVTRKEVCLRVAGPATTGVVNKGSERRDVSCLQSSILSERGRPPLELLHILTHLAGPGWRGFGRGRGFGAGRPDAAACVRPWSRANRSVSASRAQLRNDR